MTKVLLISVLLTLCSTDAYSYREFSDEEFFLTTARGETQEDFMNAVKHGDPNHIWFVTATLNPLAEGFTDEGDHGIEQLMLWEKFVGILGIDQNLDRHEDVAKWLEVMRRSGSSSNFFYLSSAQILEIRKTDIVQNVTHIEWYIEPTPKCCPESDPHKSGGRG